MKHKILFSICARGGSKGLLNKNISEFHGKPLIAVTIEQAFLSNYCEDVYISTDSEEIANISKRYGAKVLEMRPASLANDEASKFDVWKHHLKTIEELTNNRYDYFFDLDCTCPLRPLGDIDHMIDCFMGLSSVHDGIITICESRKNPYFNMLEVRDQRFLKISKALDSNIVRRQDAPRVYDHVASMYLLKSDYIKNAYNLFDGDILGYKIPYERSLDIDSELDKELVSFLFANLNKELGSICI